MCLKTKCLLFAAGALFAATSSAPASAQAHRHVIEIHRGYPHGYRHVFVPRERFYRGYPVVRHYGPVFGGFGYFYDDRDAWRFFGFTAWQLALAARLNEEQMRAHEAAIVEAATGPVDEPVEWNDGPASGSVTATREGHTKDGRPCREFQQQVTIAGASEQAYGTACQQADGSWQIVRQ
ncbi:MAG: RT0821/Lpp0805 family surface protein [Rhodospirillaceae bacterium]